MMRQLGAHRCMGGPNPLRVGVIAVGSSYYIQDNGYFRDRCSPLPICRNPWQVEGFSNGLLHAARRNRDTGRWEDTCRSGRSEMAVVRSLRDGRRRTVAVRLLILHDDLGLTKGVTAYPTPPDLRFYRCRPRKPTPAPVLDQAA